MEVLELGATVVTGAGAVVVGADVVAPGPLVEGEVPALLLPLLHPAPATLNPMTRPTVSHRRLRN